MIAGLLAMRVTPPSRAARNGSAAARILEGFRFVARTKPIRSILMMLGLISLVGMPFSVLVPVFASEILHGGASTLGGLMSSTGIGALTGALLLARRSGYGGLGRLIAGSATAFGVSLIPFAFSRDLLLSLVLLFPVGVSMMMQMPSSNTLIQAMAPDHLRGRVMAVYSIMFLGMAPFGALLAGALAHVMGAPAVVAAGGVVSIVGGILFVMRLPRLRPEARELIIAQAAVPGEPAEEVTTDLTGTRPAA